jgi:hypothetical protein
MANVYTPRQIRCLYALHRTDFRQLWQIRANRDARRCQANRHPRLAEADGDGSADRYATAADGDGAARAKRYSITSAAHHPTYSDTHRSPVYGDVYPHVHADRYANAVILAGL